MAHSPVDELLAQLQARLNAERTELVQRVRAIESALERYHQASEAEVARAFAAQHGLKRPKPDSISPRVAAERLYTLVRALPELAGLLAEPKASAPSSECEVEPPQALADGRFASLIRGAAERKLVIIGGLAGRQKRGVLPAALQSRTEWVDTERDGVHAIGNLPQRIRQQRVLAVVILERAIQHKHSEPVVAAARDANTPVAFAGQGGRASLIEALEQLDARLKG